MPIQAQPTTASERAYDLIARYLLPLGVVMLLAGLPLLPDRSIYHKVYYGLVCLPALIMALARPSMLRPLVRDPIFIAFAAFIVWVWLSIVWTDASESWTSLAKWPLYVILLFVAFTLLQRHNLSRFFTAVHVAAVIFCLCTLYALVEGAPLLSTGFRLIGTGALSNPLLSSHLFGFFTVFWLVSTAMRSSRASSFLFNGAATAVMLVAVLASGSRTPLLALTFTSLWLCLLRPNRQTLTLIAMAILGSAILFTYTPELLLSRGLSYRPEIWQQALGLIQQHPWVGHGYNTPIAIPIEGIGMTFSEPHNFALSVLHNVGIVGFLPWVLMQALALWIGWCNRHDWRFVLASAWMMYGIFAALTEGGSILSRPKEHWFLLWIPLATMAALSAVKRASEARIQLTPLGKAELNALMDGGTIIEQDGLGPKVVKLRDGSFLKLFRRKQWLSSASLSPYSRRFAYNSLALSQRQVETPEVLECFRFDDGSTGVHYQPLPGITLRQALERAPDGGARARIVRQTGQFIGELHERGVYFRSLHLGNVLVLPDGKLALIDIADMRLFNRPLTSQMRQRNLKHMQRYKQDRYWLFEEQRSALAEGYALGASGKAADTLLSSL
ncbi:O-antigen ligase family protein [Stutzerimonas stutzeri]